MTTAIQPVKYVTDTGNSIELNAQIVRDFLVQGNGAVNDREIVLFMMLCKAHNLDPFLREAYLVKYTNDSPATMITGKETFTKRAFRIPHFDGMEAGVTVLTENGELIQRPGSLVLKKLGEELVGGWARILDKRRSVPFFEEVSLDEYIGTKWDSEKKMHVPTAQWRKMPATMIRKVALVHALREAFPEDFSGLYDAAEMNVEIDDLPDEIIDVEDISGKSGKEKGSKTPNKATTAAEPSQSDVNECKALKETLDALTRRYATMKGTKTLAEACKIIEAESGIGYKGIIERKESMLKLIEWLEVELNSAEPLPGTVIIDDEEEGII